MNGPSKLTLRSSPSRSVVCVWCSTKCTRNICKIAARSGPNRRKKRTQGAGRGVIYIQRRHYHDTDGPIWQSDMTELTDCHACGGVDVWDLECCFFFAETVL